MFSSNPKTFTLTLFFYIALTLVAATGSNVNRRDHLELTRLIKKRAPLPQGGTDLAGVLGVAPDPAASKQSSTAAPTDPTTAATPQESSSAISSAASATPLIVSLVMSLESNICFAYSFFL